MKKAITNYIKGSNFVIKILFRSTPLFIILFIFINIIVSIIPAVNVILSKNIIDGLIGIYDTGETGSIWKYIIILFALTVFNSLLNNSGMIIVRFMEAKNEKYLNSMILDKISRIEIRHLENSGSIDAVDAAMDSRFYISRSLYTYVSIMTAAVTFLSMISIIFVYYPLIALFYLSATIPAVIISSIQNRKMSQFEIDSIPETRKKGYYYDMLTSAQYAKDIRLYDLAEPFRETYNELWKKIISQREALFKDGFKKLNLATIVKALGYIGLYVYLIYKTYTGELSIGGLTAFTAAVISISWNFGAFVSSLAHYCSLFLPRILRIMDFFGWRDENAATAEDTSVPEGDFDITFDHVTFAYPGTDNMVLRDVSFTIKSGDKLALVGVNGAGKSTIIKLLLRMYEQDGGRILINGTDIRNCDINSYRGLFSACFQDVTRYSLTLAENVSLSDLSSVSDTEKLSRAVAASGLGDVRDSLAKGLDTPLTRMFEPDGAELSGGQWQKVSIARAFFRDVLFVILDEPSSALDPKAESQIFNSFSELCGDKSGILISHRLSSIMMVDRIVFIEDGRVTESGTHSELMRQNGRYAEMYRLQAEKYGVARIDGEGTR